MMIFPVDRRRWLAGAAGSLWSLACSGPVWAAGAAAAPVLSPVTVPALPLRQRRLANGLQVVAIPDAASARASIQVWYRVGAKDDPPGRSGFAHLFEHLMFKATEHMPAETIDRLTEDVGGGNNAFTAEDVTAYHADIPANHLERLVWAEAERMSNLRVNEGNFKSERAVVQEEFRQGVLADPYGLFYESFVQHAFVRHPYRRPVIGSLEDLDAATLDDVRAFHATFYRPDNAMLVVAGGFDPAQFDGWVDRYFGPLRAPSTPIPRVDVQEPPLEADKRVRLDGPNVPLPALALVWHGPKADSADAPALEVVAKLLAGGDSSRLNQTLVYDQRIAQSADVYAGLFQDAGLIAVSAVATGRKPLRTLEAAMQAQVRRLATGAIAAAELDKVRTQMLTEALVERQTPNGKAMAVGEALIYHRDATFADRELGLLQAVTAADVQRVLQRYLLGSRHVAIEYVQRRSA
jgi:zinc protease